MKLLPFAGFMALAAGIALAGCSDDETDDGDGAGASGSGASGSGASGATGSGATGSGASGATGGDGAGGDGATGGEAVGGAGSGGEGGGSMGDAQAFCDLYETTCGYGGPMSFEDEADCLAEYAGFEGTIDDQTTKLGCVEYHLDNAVGDPDTHCPHAAGNGPCNI